MKTELVAIISVLLALNNSVKAGGYNSPYSPYQQQQQRQGLDFSGSVQQAKDQLRYFFAGSKPVNATLNDLENYYVDVKERDMDAYVEPRKRIRRPPCKVLPDPEPGLVNPLLVAPVHKFRPLRRNVKFYGKFAPPLSYEYQNGAAEMVVGSMPPVKKQYAVPPAANPAPIPYPVIQKQTVYAPNPFYGYKSEYNAESDYFQRPKPTATPPGYNADGYYAPAPTVTATTTTNWQDNLNTDYAQRMSSMSAALASNSAALASLSWSAKEASLISQWSAKESSLWAKIASLSTATESDSTTTTKRGWSW